MNKFRLELLCLTIRKNKNVNKEFEAIFAAS